MTQRGRLALFWITTVVVASLLLGLGIGLGWIGNPGMQRRFMASVGAVMIISGIFLLTPYAMKRPLDPSQSQVRRRLSVMASGNIVCGIALMIPNSKLSLGLMGVQMLLMIAAATAWPKGLFAPPPG